MARLINCGFELNSLTAGLDITNLTGSPSISSTKFRSGQYSLRINGFSSGASQSVYFIANNSLTITYFKCHFRVTARPALANRIIYLSVNNAPTMLVYVALNADGTLTLGDEDGVIGTGATVLAMGKWHSVSVGCNLSAAGGSHIITLRIGSSDEVTASNRNVSGTIGRWRVGANLASEAQTVGDWYFDDIVVNDNTGTTIDNTWPNPDAALVYLFPNAAGDNSAWTASAGSNYQCVDDVTPNDATDYVSSNTLNQIDEYNLTAATGAIVGTINSVHIYHRWQDNSSTASRTTQRIRASSGGTVEETSGLNLPATWTTNVGSYPPVSLSLYDLPGASTTTWSVSALDTTQIGQKLATAGTANTDVTAVWLVVEYILVASAVGITLLSYSGGDTIAADLIDLGKYERDKLIHGADGVNDGDVSNANPFPVKSNVGGATFATAGANDLVSAELLPSNDLRMGAVFYVSSPGAICFLKLGVTASLSDYSVRIYNGETFVLPFNYTGVVHVIWDTSIGGGTIFATEMY